MTEDYIKTKIERVRYLFKFETLSSYTAINEITFANEGHTPISTIKYDLGEYKPFLKITDTNSETLEFARAQEAGCGGCSNYFIDIYLPKGRELQPNCRRTITFQNYSLATDGREEPNYKNVKYAIFHFEMIGDANSYVIIEAPEYFGFDSVLDIVDQGEEETDEYELMNLVREGKITRHKDGKRVYFSFMGDSSRRTLRITHRHDVPPRLLNWIKAGWYFGAVSAILIPIGLFYSLKCGAIDNLNAFVTYPVFVITTLIVIKGWLFLKDLDDKLERYNAEYIALVVVLIFELIGVFATSCLVCNAVV